MMDAVAERVLSTVLAGVGLNMLIMVGSLALNWKLFAYRLRRVEEVTDHIVERVAAIEITCAATHQRRVEG